MKAYLLLNLSTPTVYGYETSIAAVTDRLLHWCSISEKYSGNTPFEAMEKLPTSTPIAVLPDDMKLSQDELAKVQRALQFQDSMSDARLEEALAKEKRLIKRIAALTEVQNDSERAARQQAQGKEDILTANAKWTGWTIEKRRSFVRLVTDSITLEELAPSWIKVTFVWSPIMGFIDPMTSSNRMVDIGYLWRTSGTHWTTEEESIVTAMYHTQSRQTILKALPTRSWASIIGKAAKLGVVRSIRLREENNIPIEQCLNDVAIMQAHNLNAATVQWKHVLLANGALVSSCAG